MDNYHELQTVEEGKGINWTLLQESNYVHGGDLNEFDKFPRMTLALNLHGVERVMLLAWDKIV